MSRKLKQFGWEVLRKILQANYDKGQYKDIFWIIGDGRSGTTWLADLINYRGSYRKMFEPFHPQLVEGMDIIAPHQYISPNAAQHPLGPISDAVFSGQFNQYRVDSRNRRLRYSGVVIKDIFANLFAKWAAQRQPDMNIVMTIRNPFAVALSKARKSDWLWLKDPLELLDQADLLSDHLDAHHDFIRHHTEISDEFTLQILIWAIIHYVPLRQFSSNEISVVFYEDLFHSPSEQIQSLFDEFSLSIPHPKIVLAESLIRKPTRSAGGNSNIAMGSSPVTSWLGVISTKQIDHGMKILDQFGLSEIYSGESTPQMSGKRLLSELNS